jgi:hypothetical protein
MSSVWCVATTKRCVPADLEHERTERGALLRIQTCGRLVQEQKIRLPKESLRKPQAASHAARQLAHFLG